MKHHKKKILVVDDEASIRCILETQLTMLGYQVLLAADGEEALAIYRHQVPDLVILDVILPDLDGFGVCQALRQDQKSDVPIVMLTAMTDVTDRIVGLDLGADDYIVKPFSPQELESRIRSILRRVEKKIANSERIQVGPLQIDINKRQVYKGNELIQLTDLEFNLLELLVKRSGEPISRSEFLEQVWGCSSEHLPSNRIVDVHMAHLRSKLRENPRQPELIITVRGMGYVFQRLA